MNIDGNSILGACKHKPLTAEDKAYNRFLAKEHILNEQSIRYLKRFRSGENVTVTGEGVSGCVLTLLPLSTAYNTPNPSYAGGLVYDLDTTFCP